MIADFKTLQDHFALRVEKANHIPTPMVNFFFQKLGVKLEECQERINDRIARRLGRPEFSGLRCKGMDKIVGILDCARINTELVKTGIQSIAQDVLIYAAILNYELELMHH